METFSFKSKFLHWSIAIMLFTQIPLAWYMTDLPLGPDKFVKYGWHKQIFSFTEPQ